MVRFRSLRVLGVCVASLLAAASAAAQSSADLSVSKSGPGSVAVSSNITFTVTVSNLGPNAAASATLTDTLPANTTFVSVFQTSGPAFSCSDPGVGVTGGSVVCSIATLTANATATFDITVHAPITTAGQTATNSANVSSQTPDNNSQNDTATASTQIFSAADLFVSKSGPASVAPGANITFTVTLGNLGPSDALSATLTDNLPANTTFVSVSQTSGPTFTCSDPGAGASGGSVVCSIGTLAANAAASFDITINAPPQSGGQTAINSATVSSETQDLNPENNNSIAGTQITGGTQADVGIAKSGPAGAAPNSDVSYTITVSSFGPNTATNVTWTDTLPATLTFVSLTPDAAWSCTTGATVTCSRASMPSGATSTFTLVAHLGAASSGAEVTNSAHVTSDNDQNPENDNSSTTLTVSSADVGVVKSGPSTAVAGTAYDYIITLSNGGPDFATDATFSDTLPSALRFVSLTQDTGPAANCNTPPVNTNGIVACTIPLLPNGGSAQFTLRVQPATATPNGTLVTNTATATASSADLNPNNDSSTVQTTVSAQADLSIVKSGPPSATAGTNVTYAIAVANGGPSDAASANWSDTLPAGTTFVSLTQNTGPAFNCTTGATVSCSIASFVSSASATFTLVVHVSAGAAAGTLSNTATIASATPDPNVNNNTSTTPATLSVSADLAVTKTAPVAATAGQTLAYSITVTNNGPSDATAVNLTDLIPPNTTFASLSQNSGPVFTCTTPPVNGTGPVTCSTASLLAGASAPFTLTVNVPAGTPNNTVISNTANVTAATPDPNAGNNSATATTTVGASADLAVTKSGPSSAPFAGTATYNVTVTNNGPSTAVNVTLTDTVPASMGFASATQTSGPPFNCTAPPAGAGGTITCTAPSLASGASAAFQFVFGVSATATVGSTTTNTATVSSPTPDPNPANNTATVTTTVAQSIPLLSPWALLAMALALAVLGALKMR